MAIATLDHKAARELLNATPSLATATLDRRDEFFLAARLPRRHRVACRGLQL